MKILIISLPDICKINYQRPHHIINHLANHHDVSVISCNAWGLNNEIDQRTVDLLKRVRFKYLTLKKVRHVIQEILIVKEIRKLRKESFDVIISFHSFIAGPILSIGLGHPMVIDICDDVIDWISHSSGAPRFLHPFLKQFARVAVGGNLVCSSLISYTTKFISDAYNLPPEKSVLIPNGVDTRCFFPQQSGLRDKCDIPESAFIVGFVGYLGDWLDFSPIFSAIKMIKASAEIRLIIVGEGNQYEKTVDLANELGVTEYVQFLGNKPYKEIPGIISGFDLCILPFNNSNVSQNAVPLKIFEYFACSKPVVSAPLQTIREIFMDSIRYYENDLQLAGLLKEFMGNPELGLRLGRKGSEIVKNNYEWNSICSVFENAIITCVARGE